MDTCWLQQEWVVLQVCFVWRGNVLVWRVLNIKNWNRNQTSGHLKLEVLIRRLDTKTKTRNKTNDQDVQRSVQEFSISSSERSVETPEACKIHCFSLCFEHIFKFEAISKDRPLTGQALEALFENSPKNFNVFLAWFYSTQMNYEQRHRRRTTHFARATARETYYRFCKNDQRHRRRTTCFF